MSTTPFIELKNVVFAYGDRLTLHDINFIVEQGDFATIIGSSGSGKTTLMHLITGQIHLQQGQILIEGRDVVRLSDAELYGRRRRMGVLFQHGALFTDFSVYDNIVFPMRELAGLPEDVIRDLVVLRLNAVGLRGVECLMPSELSGGISHRVAPARTIALDPEIMFYDESFTGFNPTLLGVIAHPISRVDEALHSTSIMVTHDIEKPLEIVSQVIFLAHGEIMFSGPPQEMRELGPPWTRQFIGSLADGLVAFRYPAQTTLQQDLVG